MIHRNLDLVMMMISLLISLDYSESFSIGTHEDSPAEWAVKWNGIGKSNNPAHGHAYAWRGTDISEEEKQQLIRKIESQPANEVYTALLARPAPKISFYGTCAVGIVRGMPTFWVDGMYGSVGHSGYPKNPISKDATGHLQGCYHEHQITGLCSYTDVAERAKQTLLYAVKNDVCTNYYNVKELIGTISQNNPSLIVPTTDEIKARAEKFLSQVGLRISPAGKGDQWMTLCELKVDIKKSGLNSITKTGTCSKTVKGVIKELRVQTKEKWRCEYETESYTSDAMINAKNKINNQYDDAINLAIKANDQTTADYLRSMKDQHIQNLEISSNYDTAKLTAKATSAPRWGGGAICNLVLEGLVNEFY